MEKTWKPTTAGILIIIAGGGGIFGGALLALYTGVFGIGIPWLGHFAGEWINMYLGALYSIIGIIGVALIVIGIITMVGGVYTLRRRNWGFALAGAILATICDVLLGVLSIIFLTLSKEEFDQPKAR